MYPSIQDIKAVLLKESYISAEDSEAAEKVAHDTGGYIDYLIRQQLLTKSLLGQALAESYKLPFADLTATSLTKEQILQIPEATARAMRLALMRNDDKSVLLATDTPGSLDPKQLLALFPGKKVQVAYTLPESLASAFELYEQPLATRFS